MFRLPENLCTGRDEYRYIRAVFAVPLGAFAMPPPLSLEYLFVSEMQQGIDPIGALDIYAASIAAVTSAGAALRNEFFPPERDTPVPSVSSDHMNFCAVYKHRFSFLQKSLCQIVPVISPGILAFRRHGPALSIQSLLKTPVPSYKEKKRTLTGVLGIPGF